MRLVIVLILALVWVPAVPAAASGLSGSWVMNTSNGTFTLTLQESGNQLTGELVGATGHRMMLQGEVSDGVGMGVMRDNQGGVFFEVFAEGSALVLMLIEPDANNMPDYNRARELQFSRSSTASPPGRSTGQAVSPVPARSPAAGASGGLGAGAGANPLAGQAPADPLVGTFSGNGVVLTVSGGNGQYTGTLSFSGNRYPVKADGGGSRLSGTFNASGSDFLFSATLNGSQMTFQTGGTTYQLTKQGAAAPAPAANPLQKSSPGQSANRPSGGSAGGQTITDEQSGVSLTIPAGWKAQQTPGGYVMGSDTHKGLIIITGHGYSSVQQMHQESGQGIQDEQSNISLMPSGQIVQLGNNGLGVEMTGSVQGTQARAYTVGLVSPHGGGIVIIAMTSAEAYTGQYRQWAEQIAGSTRFSRPKVDTALMQWFAGKYWRYTSSSSYTSSYSTESSMTFCANGNYHDSYESGGSGTGHDQYGNQSMSYGAVGTQQNVARWTIRGNKQQGVITVRKPDGDVYDINYRAVGEGQDMYFDGTRYNWVNRGDCN